MCPSFVYRDAGHKYEETTMSDHIPHPLTRRAAVAGTAITFGVGAAIPAALAVLFAIGLTKDKTATPD